MLFLWIITSQIPEPDSIFMVSSADSSGQQQEPRPGLFAMILQFPWGATITAVRGPRGHGIGGR